MIFFSENEILKQIKNNIKVISVGSAHGYIEKYLIENGKNVICIDPSKSKINPYTDEKRVKEPDYKNVKEYLDKNEDNEDCQLLLHYPLSDYVTYDICSIYDLNPKYITIMCSYDGESGSIGLHIWLRKCGVDTIGKLITEKDWEMEFDFNKLVKNKYKPIFYKKEENFILTTLERITNEYKNNYIYSPKHEEKILNGLDNTLKGVENCEKLFKKLCK
jgi:hypothetical protein